MKMPKLLLNLFLVFLIFGPVTINRLWAWAADSRVMSEFISWMRQHQYDPAILEIYQCNYRDPCLRPIIRDYFKLRRGDFWRRNECAGVHRQFKGDGPFRVFFIEAIPSKGDVQYGLVDLKALEGFRAYFRTRFGKDIDIHHQKIKIDYDKKLIADLADRSVYYKTGSQLEQLMQRFPKPCLIRFDAEVVNGQKIPQVWDVDRCAMFSGEDMRLANNVNAFDRYAHELAHLLGLGHQFVDSGNRPVTGSFGCDLKKGKGRYLGVDDIMVKTKYAENKVAGHYLSPLSRFALEPRGGYVDNDEFGRTYSALYDKETLKRIRDQACTQ